MPILWIFVAFIAWVLLGCLVLSWVDERGELLKWYRAAPGSPFQRWILQCAFWVVWPGVVMAYRKP